LCELCHRAEFDYVIAHCNFALRGAESDRDENFVVSLGEKYGKQVLVKKFDTEEYALEHKCSIQVAARELRYDWFRSRVDGSWLTNSTTEDAVKRQRPTVNFIATGHHLDDNAETMAMNFFKGTGIAGLHGILPRQGNLVRPLLFAKKETLRTFALEQKLNWVEDSSNALDEYTRNYFRNQVFPMIRQVYPDVINNLASNANRFREIEMLYQESVMRQKKKLIEQKGDEFHIPVLKLKKTEPLQTMVFEIIREFGFSSAQIGEFLDLMDSDSGKYIQSASHQIIKNRQWLIIAPRQSISSQTILIEKGMRKIIFENGTLKMDDKSALTTESNVRDSVNRQPSRINYLTIDKNTAWLDSSSISYPLILRKWQQGDYFYPLGMRKKKKLARFFIDQKLSKRDKEKVWVLEMNKKIIWVVGMRIDDRFKLDAASRSMLKIEMESK
jgi:tRNA(Ile)-lysidine synthase